MKNEDLSADGLFRAYLVSKLLSIIGNFPIYYEKKLTGFPFSIEGIRVMTTRDGISFLDNPDNFLIKKLYIDADKGSFLIESALYVRNIIIASDSEEKLKYACKQCLQVSNEIIFNERFAQFNV